MYEASCWLPRLLLCHTNLCIWTNTYLCRSFFLFFWFDTQLSVWHAYRQRTTKFLNHYKPHQTRYQTIFKIYSYLFRIVIIFCSFHSFIKLSHIIFIVCYVCVPAPRQLLFFCHHFYNLIFLWLNSFSISKPTNLLQQEKTTKIMMTKTKTTKTNSHIHCMNVAFLVFAKISTPRLLLLTTFFFFIHRFD